MHKLFQGKDVTLSYMMDDVKVEALKNLNFEIDSGKFTCLAGASGSGKINFVESARVD